MRETDRFRFGTMTSQSKSSAKMDIEHVSRISGSCFNSDSGIDSGQNKCAEVSEWNPTSRQWLRVNPRLLLLVFQRGFVPGFFDSGDELLRIRFALLDFDDCFVGMGYLSADDARNFFECRPHSLGTVDRSGHPRDLQVHSFLGLRLGCLRVACGRSGKSPRRVVSREHQHRKNEYRCFIVSHAASLRGFWKRRKHFLVPSKPAIEQSGAGHENRRA